MKFGSQLQTNWDWRAACNFMFGGTGSALIFIIVLFSFPQTAPLMLTILALGLVGLGLFMVWLEIGRPWRFLHVFYHPNTSWMTREASVGSILFPVTIAGAVLKSTPVLALAACLGVVFLYCQGRILKAAQGVPAWRTQSIVPLIMSTGFVEATGIAIAFAYLTGAQQTWLIPFFSVALIVRAWAWFAYQERLRKNEAPAGALKAFSRIRLNFLLTGIFLPLVFCAIAFTGILSPVMVLAAGISATYAGWMLKFTIVVKAAFKQGYGIGKLRKGRPTLKAPVRRHGDPIQY